jgi:hypothetical protein
MRRIAVVGDTKSQVCEAESVGPLEIDLSVFDRVYRQYTSEPAAGPVPKERPDFPEIDISNLHAVGHVSVP